MKKKEVIKEVLTFILWMASIVSFYVVLRSYGVPWYATTLIALFAGAGFNQMVRIIFQMRRT